MDLSTAIREIESWMDYTAQTERMDEVTLEALNLLLEAAKAQTDQDN